MYVSSYRHWQAIALILSSSFVLSACMGEGEIEVEIDLEGREPVATTTTTVPPGPALSIGALANGYAGQCIPVSISTPSVVASNITVQFYLDSMGSGGNWFSANDCSGTSIPSLDLAAGQNNLVVYFEPYTVGTFTLRASATGYTDASVSFSTVAGSADSANSSIVASTASAAADGSASIGVTVTLKDKHGNPISGTAVSLSSTGTGNSLTQPASATNASGVATGSIKSTIAEAKTLSITAPTGLSNTVGVTFTVVATPALTMSAVADSQAGVCIPVTISTPANVVSNLAVNLYIDAGGGAWHLANDCSDASVASGTISSGSSSLTAYFEPSSVGAITLRASAAGYTDASDPFSTTAGSPSSANSTISVSPATLVADGTASATVTITLKDKYSNPISGTAVSFSSTGTGNTLTAPAPNTDASGQSSGSIKSTVHEAKTLSISAPASLAATATVTFTIAPPDAPTAVTATPGVAQVTLSWTAGTRATGYEVRSKPSAGGTYGTWATVSSPWTHSTLTNGTTYYYELRSTNSAGTASAAEVSATPQAVPTAPTALSGTLSSSTSLSLSWTDNATNETAYHVYCAVGAGAWGPCETLAADSTSLTKGSLALATTYHYKVAAYNSVSGLSTFAGPVTVTTPSPALLSISDGPSFDYGAVGIGISNDKTFTVSNAGGVKASAINGALTSNAGFKFKGGSYPGLGGDCATILAPAASCKIVVSFKPTAAPAESDTIAINYNDGSIAQTSSRAVSGTGLAGALLEITHFPKLYYEEYGVPLDSAVFGFGDVGVGKTAKHTFFITNIGSLTAGSINTGSVVSGWKYSLVKNTCPASLPKGESCAIEVSISPDAVGNFDGSLAITYNDGVGTAAVSKSLNAVGKNGPLLTIWDHTDDFGSGLNMGADYDFGKIGVGQESRHSFYVKNKGTNAATLSAGTFVGEFSWAGTGFPGGTAGQEAEDAHAPYCGASLPAGETCAVTVKFVPSAAASTNGSFSVNYDGGLIATRTVKGEGTNYALLTLEARSESSGGGDGLYVNLGYQPVATPRAFAMILRNVGAQAANTLAVDTLGTGFRYFNNDPNPTGSKDIDGELIPYCSTSLVAGGKCVYSLEFVPPSNLEYAHTFRVNYSDSSNIDGLNVSKGVVGEGTTLAILKIAPCSQNGDGYSDDFVTPTYDLGYVQSNGLRNNIFFCISNSGSGSANLAGASAWANGFSHDNAGTAVSFPGGTAGNAAGDTGKAYCGATLDGISSCAIRVQFDDQFLNGEKLAELVVSTTNSVGSQLKYKLRAEPTDSAIVSLGYCDSNRGEMYADQSGTPSDNLGYLAANVSHGRFYCVHNKGEASTTLGHTLALGAGYSLVNGTAGSPAGDTGKNYCYLDASTLLAGNSSCAVNVNFSHAVNATALNTLLQIDAATAVNGPAKLKLSAHPTDQAIVSIRDWTTGGSSGEPFNFGSAGFNMDKVFFLKNSGNTAATFSAPNVASDTPGVFQWAGTGFPGGSVAETHNGTVYNFCGNTLAADAECIIKVSYVFPNNDAEHTGSVSFTLGGSTATTLVRKVKVTSTTRVALSVSEGNDEFPCIGTGCSPVDFGTYGGTAIDKILYVRNRGAIDANVGMISVDATAWSIPSSSNGAASGETAFSGTPFCSGVLSSAATCVVRVRFVPPTGEAQSQGNFTINVTDNAINPYSGSIGLKGNR